MQRRCAGKALPTPTLRCPAAGRRLPGCPTHLLPGARPCSWCQSCPQCPGRACRRRSRPPPGCSTAGQTCKHGQGQCAGVEAVGGQWFSAATRTTAGPTCEQRREETPPAALPLLICCGGCRARCRGMYPRTSPARPPTPPPTHTRPPCTATLPLTCCGGCRARGRGRSAPPEASGGAHHPCKSRRRSAPPAACKCNRRMGESNRKAGSGMQPGVVASRRRRRLGSSSSLAGGIESNRNAVGNATEVVGFD